MSIGVSFSINVSQIDKSKLIEGKKGKYLDMTCFINDELDTYGNRGMITQSVSKEERAAGIQGAILGNVRVFHGDSVSFIATGGVPQAAPQVAPPAIDLDEDLPF
jgi:hypothetical protein